MSEQGAYWKQTIIRRGCAMCRHACPPADIQASRRADISRLQAHHILSQQDIKRERFHDALLDERNGLCLCVYHHQRHEARTEAVPRGVLPAAVFEFAAELDARVGGGREPFQVRLDREYP